MSSIVSTPLTRGNHIQTIGRIIRKFPNKTAKIYVLLADGTNDTKLIANGGMKGTLLDYGTGATRNADYAADLKPGDVYDGYYEGDEYHVDHRGSVWIRNGDGNRKYLVEPKLRNAISKIMRYKGGGRFKINGKGNILTMVKGKIMYLGDITDFQPEYIVEEPVRKITWEELMEVVA
jgi:hypothetical protein